MKIPFIVIALVLIVSCASAERIEIRQGDVVYMGETVDISQAVSWPDYTLAWCADDNEGCYPPDQTIEITGYMYNYYIDPNIFHYGTYYRWDGAWHRAENAVAFTIIRGNRTDKKYDGPDELKKAPAQIKDVEGPFTYLIARGDSPTVYTKLNRSDYCYLWIFDGNLDVFGVPMDMSNLNESYTTYSYTIPDYDTINITAGEYPAYIQCVGSNHYQDIFFKNYTLDTPYDDDIIPDVEIETWNLLNLKERFDTLKSSLTRFGFNDDIYEVTVVVEEPYIFVKNIERNDEDTKLFISGITSWQNQTVLTFKLDPDRHITAQDVRLNTWTTTAKGSIDAPRTFATAISLDKRELFVGMHEIISKVEKNEDVGFTSYSFRISDIRVMPTPTPEIKRILHMEDGSAIPVRTEPTPSEKPDIYQREYNTSGNKTVGIVSINASVTVTPNITATATTIPKPTPKPTTTVVVPTWIGIPISAIVFAVWRRHGIE